MYLFIRFENLEDFEVVVHSACSCLWTMECSHMKEPAPTVGHEALKNIFGKADSLH